LSLLLISILSPTAAGCTKNAVTGKTQLILIPRSYEISMGLQAAPQVATQFGGPVADTSLQAYIQMVGKKVADVTYNGYAPDTPDPNTAQFLGMHKRLMKSATFKSGPQPGQ